MNDSGMGGWMGYLLHANVWKEQGNSTLPYPEWLWYSSGIEAILDYSEEIMIEKRNYTEVGNMRLNWEGISKIGDKYGLAARLKSEYKK